MDTIYYLCWHVTCKVRNHFAQCAIIFFVRDDMRMHSTGFEGQQLVSNKLKYFGYVDVAYFHSFY